MASVLPLSKDYAWLAKETAPRILVEAVKLHGVAEIPGPRHSPLIMDWLDELNYDWIKSDEIAWCGTSMAICVKRAGKPTHPNMPSARYWLKWGTPIPKGEEKLGDILVFDGGSRGANSGHVGLYVGEDDTHFHVLGGNQSNRFCVARILKSRLIGARRTPWTSFQPASVRKVRLSPKGAPVSSSEG